MTRIHWLQEKSFQSSQCVYFFTRSAPMFMPILPKRLRETDISVFHPHDEMMGSGSSTERWKATTAERVQIFQRLCTLGVFAHLAFISLFSRKIFLPLPQGILHWILKWKITKHSPLRDIKRNPYKGNASGGSCCSFVLSDVRPHHIFFLPLKAGRIVFKLLLKTGAFAFYKKKAPSTFDQLLGVPYTGNFTGSIFYRILEIPG